MYASKRSHSSVGMTSSTNNIEYDVNGIQSGECQTIFSSTITDIVTPLQTGGQSQNLNSMTGSLERGNKGANCEGEKEYKFKEHKCVKCGSDDLCIANDWCDECIEKPTTVRLSSGSIVHMASMPVATKPKIKIIKAEERQRRAELERMDKEIKTMDKKIKETKEENKKLREMIEENKKHREMIDDAEENQILRGMIQEDMKLLWFTVCTPPEWHDGKFYDKSVEIMEKYLSFADLQNLKKQRDRYMSGHAEVPILKGVVFE